MTNICFGQEKIRATAGWGDNSIVKFDTITPLPDLINKLAAPWQFVETGKGYWIGYTDNMYSIARYKGNAINPLVKFIKSTSSTHAKIGALYSLHLIGIESKIAGRLLEHFKDTFARQAIIQFINDDSLHNTVMFLLSRDRWTTDIPYFLNYLSEEHNKYSRVLGALECYHLPNLPMGQQIPKVFRGREFKIKCRQYARRESFFDLVSLKNVLGDSIIIDTAITNSDDYIQTERQIQKKKLREEEMDMGSILEYFTQFYCSFDEKNILYVYSPEAARTIWVNWWKEQKVNNPNFR